MKAIEYSKNNVLVFIDPRVNIFRKNKKVLSLDFGSMVRISLSDEGLLAVASGMEKTVIFNLNCEPTFKEEREIAGFWHISKSGSELFSINQSGLVAMSYASGEIRVVQPGLRGNPSNLYLNDDGSIWAYVNSKKNQINYSNNQGVGTFNWNKGSLGVLPEEIMFDAEKRWIFIRHDFYKFKMLTRIGLDNSIKSLKSEKEIFTLPIKINGKYIIACETSMKLKSGYVSGMKEITAHFYYLNADEMQVGEPMSESIYPGGYPLVLDNGNIAFMNRNSNPQILQMGDAKPKIQEEAEIEFDNKNTISYEEISQEIANEKIDVPDFTDLFSNYLPNVSNINGLDLNYNHDFYADVTVFPNFGFKDLYSIGGTGHDYLVYCIIPGVKPENYPIAIYGEEEGCAKIIASSVKTWFPAYLLYTINDLLTNFWYYLKKKDITGAAYPLKDLESIQNSKEEIFEICKEFENKEFMDILPLIFEVLDEKDQTDHPEWKFADFYMIAEKDSYLGTFYGLLTTNTPLEKWVELIKANKHFNYPLFLQFADKHSERIYIEKRDISGLPAELAAEVFTRILPIGFNNTGMIDKILKTAIKAGNTNDNQDNIQYAGFIKKIAEKKEYEKVDMPEEFYNLGKSLAEEKKYNQAVVAFWNAMFLYHNDTEGIYYKAYTEIIRNYKNIEDIYFKKYLMEYNEVISEFIEESED